MAQNFIACDREQVLLLPPSVRDWLPDDHLALFVIDAVSQLDLEAFYGSYRRDVPRGRHHVTLIGDGGNSAPNAKPVGVPR